MTQAKKPVTLEEVQCATCKEVFKSDQRFEERSHICVRVSKAYTTNEMVNALYRYKYIN
jgi:hypothetical protein